MYQETKGRLLNHSECCQVRIVASLLAEALSRLPWTNAAKRLDVSAIPTDAHASFSASTNWQLRLRPRRKLCGYSEDRASVPGTVAHPAGCEDGDLRIHRGLLQHEA